MAGIERKSNFRDGLSLTGGETWMEYHSTELWVARRQGCCCSVAKLCPTLCDPMDDRFAQTYVHWVGIQPPHPQLPPSPPALNLSQYQGLFQWVSSSHQVAKILQLQIQHQSFQWMTRVDTFRMDWFDLLAVLGTLKNLFQHHSLKASILWHSAFFMVQLSHPYMTTEKTIALTRWTFVGNVSAF